MLTASNKARLEQEIAALIGFIAEGREFFFKKTGFSIDSPDNYLNHFVSKELFNGNVELNQLQLNVQLLYIKLSCYYELTSKKKKDELKTPRNMFAHALTPLIFSGKVNYHFFFHKVMENFKKLQFIVYDEEGMDEFPPPVKTLELELHKDINEFLSIWSEAGNEVPEVK